MEGRKGEKTRSCGYNNAELGGISKTLSELFPTFPHFLGSRKGRKAPKEGPFLFRKADQRAAIVRKAMKALRPHVEKASQNHTTFLFFFTNKRQNGALGTFQEGVGMYRLYVYVSLWALR